MTAVGVLLAAGLSRRFGAGDKLAAPLGGQPLAAHALGVLTALPLSRRFVVTGPDWRQAMPSGVERLVNPSPEAGQGGSLAIGARAAAGADRLLVLLADMPFVTVEHALAVMAACADDRPAASTDGSAAMPPACFPASWLARFSASAGDRGAGAALRNLPPEALVRASPGTLADIDTQDALARLAS